MVNLSGVLMADFWTELVSGIEADERFAILIVLVGCATAVSITGLVTLGSAVSFIVRSRTDAALKRDMLDRGLSAEEIACVIEAIPQSAKIVDRSASQSSTSRNGSHSPRSAPARI